MRLIFDTETTDRKDGEIIEAGWISLGDLAPEPEISGEAEYEYEGGLF